MKKLFKIMALLIICHAAAMGQAAVSVDTLFNRDSVVTYVHHDSEYVYQLRDTLYPDCDWVLHYTDSAVAKQNNNFDRDSVIVYFIKDTSTESYKRRMTIVDINKKIDTCVDDTFKLRNGSRAYHLFSGAPIYLSLRLHDTGSGNIISIVSDLEPGIKKVCLDTLIDPIILEAGIAKTPGLYKITTEVYRKDNIYTNYTLLDSFHDFSSTIFFDSIGDSILRTDTSICIVDSMKAYELGKTIMQIDTACTTYFAKDTMGKIDSCIDAGIRRVTDTNVIIEDYNIYSFSNGRQYDTLHVVDSDQFVYIYTTTGDADSSSLIKPAAITDNSILLKKQIFRHPYKIDTAVTPDSIRLLIPMHTLTDSLQFACSFLQPDSIALYMDKFLAGISQRMDSGKVEEFTFIGCPGQKINVFVLDSLSGDNLLPYMYCDTLMDTLLSFLQDTNLSVHQDYVLNFQALGADSVRSYMLLNDFFTNQNNDTANYVLQAAPPTDTLPLVSVLDSFFDCDFLDTIQHLTYASLVMKNHYLDSLYGSAINMMDTQVHKQFVRLPLLSANAAAILTKISDTMFVVRRNTSMITIRDPGYTDAKLNTLGKSTDTSACWLGMDPARTGQFTLVVKLVGTKSRSPQNQSP